VLPPSEFAETYRRHVLQRLREAITPRVLFVGLLLEPINEAFDEIMTLAFDWGAAKLPEEHFEALEDWVWDALCAAALEAESDFDRHIAKMAPTHADIVRWNADVLKAFGCGG
jgi:hypothetical protein